MKIKSVLAAVAAAAVLTTCSAVAFADLADNGTDSATDSTETNTDETSTDNTADGASTETNTDGTNTDDTNADTGVEGVAAVVGIIALAGAAVVVSRKRA